MVSNTHRLAKWVAQGTWEKKKKPIYLSPVEFSTSCVFTDGEANHKEFN